MQVQVVGEQPVYFTNSKGETISGKNIYVAFKDENVNGLKTEKVFLKEGIDLPKDTKINDIIDISFNMKGRVENIKKV